MPQHAALALPVPQKPLQGLAKLPAGSDLPARILVLEEVFAGFGIPALHAAEPDAKLAGGGEFALLALGGLFLRGCFDAVLAGAHLEVEDAGVRHAGGKVFEQEEVADAFVGLELGLEGVERGVGEAGGGRVEGRWW